ncbi:mitotic spindle assembly checkpoint protein MAD1-like [Argonauta hians]
MECGWEPTRVFRMKRDFEAFVGGNQWDRSSKSPRLSDDPKCVLNFDQTLNEDISTHQLSNASSEEQLDWSLREAKYLKWKSDVAKYESQVQMLEAKLKQSLIETTKQINMEKQEKEQYQEKASELRSQLKLLYEKEKQLEGENAEMVNKLYKMNSQIATLKKEMVTSDSNKQQKILEHQEEIRENKEKLFDVTTKLQSSEAELVEMRAQLTATERMLQTAQHQITEMKTYKDGMETAYKLVKEQEMKLAQYEDEMVLRKNLKVQLSKMEELEKELEMLRVDNIYLKNNEEKTAVLREKLEGSQQKISRYEQRLSQYTTLECNYEAAKQQLQQWQALENGTQSGTSLTPSVLKKTLFDLQNSEAVLLEKNGNLQALVSTQESTITDLLTKVQRLESSVSSLTAKNQQNSEQIRTWQKRCFRLSAERDGYQRIIASYDHESTLMTTDSILRSRIHTLEEMVASLRQSLNIQEQQIISGNLTSKGTTLESADALAISSSSIPPAVTAAVSTLKNVNEKIDLQLREKISSLEKSLEEAMEKNNYLEMKLEERQLQGDYDPTRTKVLHMTVNPSSVDHQKRRQKMSNMQSEIDRLQARVSILQQQQQQATAAAGGGGGGGGGGGAVADDDGGGGVGGDGPGDVTLQVQKKLEEGCNCREVVELRSQLESCELKTKRLLETFKKTSQAVRETTYWLLGYRLDITATNTYKLSNTYAASPDDCLLFQRAPSGQLQLLETNFSKTTSKLIETYLQKQESIPAYLSSITLDLFRQHSQNM